MSKFDKVYNSAKLKDDEKADTLLKDKDLIKKTVIQGCGDPKYRTLTDAQVRGIIAIFSAVSDTEELQEIFDEIDPSNPNLSLTNLNEFVGYQIKQLGSKYTGSDYSIKIGEREADKLDMKKLQEYAVHKEKPEIIQKINRQQHLHKRFMDFKKDPDVYLRARNEKIQLIQNRCANRFNRIINEYMSKNIPYDLAKQYASKLVEIEYLAGLAQVNIDYPTSFKEIEGYEEFKNFQFSGSK